MKKIMFNDKYGQTNDVLEGRKTQARILLTLTLHEGDIHGDLKEVYPDKVFRCVNRWMFEYKRKVYDIPVQNYPKYSVGEIVAIAQSYKDCGYKIKQYETNRDEEFGFLYGCGVDEIPMKWPINGYNNKMFVKPELMPHQIRITNVRIQRLQDISEDDCLKEGVVVNEPKIKGAAKSYYPCEYLKECANRVGWGRVYNTPREAYSVLIDELKGKGTLESNPYFFVYDFKLIK